jgi:hypothetical protein
VSKRAKNPRSSALRELVHLLRCSRAAIRRAQPKLAIHLLTAAATDVGEARAKYGRSAATQLLALSISHMERAVVEAFTGGAS